MAEFDFANLDEWVMQSEARMEAVIQTTIERVCEIAQTPKAKGGRMPVAIGTLRNSFMSSLNNSTATVGPESYQSVLLDFGPGDVATFGWGGQASAYALRQNYGYVGTDSLGRTYNQAGNFWLENAIGHFHQVFNEEVANAKRIVGG